MHIGVVLGLAALAASIYLLLRSALRPWALGALAGSAVSVMLALGWISLRIAHVPLQLVLSLTLVLCGGFLVARASGKGDVSAATVVAFVGLVRLLSV